MENTTNTIAESLVAFLNLDLETLGERDFHNALWQYASFVTHAGDKYDGLIEYPLKSGIYFTRVSDTGNPDVFEERKRFFSKIQAHLKARIQKTIDAFEKAEQANGSERTLPLNRLDLFKGMPGKRFVIVDVAGNAAKDAFVPNGIKTNAMLDLKVEKILADLALADLLSLYDLRPGQFKRCMNCQKLYFQKTSSEKMYCSPTCGQAFRRAQMKQGE